MHKSVVIGFSALFLIAGGLVGEPIRAEETAGHPRLVEEGGQLFRQHCAVCHGLDAGGGGVAASALSTPPADLTRIAERRGGFSAGDVAAWIDGRFETAAHGSREMPIWGVELRSAPPSVAGLEQEVVRGKIDMLVAYLRSLQVNESRE